MPRPTPLSAAPQGQTSDDRFDDLVEEVTQRLEAGESVDPGQYLHLGTEQAERLRRLLPTLQALASLQSGRGSSLGSAARTAIVPPESLAKDLGDFQLGQELGRGGMGIVFAAEQRSLARRVAVKVLPWASLLSEIALDRFRTEVRAAASLTHEHIVPVYAVGCERGVHYYAMKLIDGCSLAEVISAFKVQSSKFKVQSSKLVDSSSTLNFELGTLNSSDTIPVAALVTRAIQGEADWYRSVARLGVQAARALAHAHAQGVVHRDIKPSNLLLDKSGRLWLSDFGLARLEADAGLTRTGDLLGTLRYMSPEQALGLSSDLDARADIYSLGATLYECLTLQPAIRASTRTEILRQAQDPRIATLRSLDPHVPEGLERIVLKCLRADPADRYATAAALAEDLERFLHGQSVRAKLPGPYQRARQWATRHPTAMLVAMAALAVTAAFSLVLAFFLWTADVRLRGPPNVRGSPPLASASPAPLDSKNSSESPLMPRAKFVPAKSTRSNQLRRLSLERLEDRSLLAQLTFGTPFNLGSGVNTAGNENGAAVTADGLSLLYTSYPTNEGPYQIVEASRNATNEAFANPVSAFEVNAVPSSHQPAVSQDGLTLVFGSAPSEPEGGLWQATRSQRMEPFGEVTSLGDLVPGQRTEGPAISADGLTLLFTVWDTNNVTNDIYQATRPSVNDAWGNVVMLASSVNLPGYNDAQPSISSDGLTLFFNSNRPGGFGNLDLYVSTRPSVDAPWGDAVNLGSQVNTAMVDQGPCISPDGSLLYFHSNRSGGYGQEDLYAMTVGHANDTKFYVVNDASTDQTYEYEDNGSAIENYKLASGNAAPRGAVSTAAGDKVWVVDNNKNVYVYGSAGNLLGSWTAGTLHPTAQVEGIATNGTDIWIVDGKQDKVYRYTGAASRVSGSQNAAGNFNLNSGNKDATDIVWGGSNLWVVNDSSTDKVFKYGLSGTLAGSWTITGGGGSPTGITLDPASPNHLWIVDNATDLVSQYDGATGRTSGSQGASTSFALASGNSNPQGIADPPVAGSPVIPSSSATPIEPQPFFAVDLIVAGGNGALRLWRQTTPDNRWTMPAKDSRPAEVYHPKVVDLALESYLRDADELDPTSDDSEGEGDGEPEKLRLVP